MIRKNSGIWLAYECWKENDHPSNLFPSRSTQISTQGGCYATVVGSICTTEIPVFYEKVEELSKNAYDESRCFPHAPNDSSTTVYSKCTQIYDPIRYFLFWIKDGQTNLLFLVNIV